MKDKKFKEYLQKAEDITAPIDMEEIIASSPNPPMTSSSIIDQEDMIKLRNAMAELRAKSMMAKQGLEAYAKQMPEGIKQAKKIAEKVASLSGKKALLGVLSGGLSAAPDLLASEDVNPSEDSQVIAKRNKQFSDQAIKNMVGEEKFQELMEDSQELSKSSITENLEKLLPNKKKSEESRSYSDYVKDRKKLMGYE